MKNIGISKEGCREVIDILPVSVIFVDKNAVVTYVNQEFKNHFGKDYIKTLDKGPGDLISCINSKLCEEGCGHSEKCPICPLRNYLKTIINGKEAKAPIEVQISTIGDFGVEKNWFKVQMNPIYIEGEERFLISFIDITIYKKSSYQLLEHKKLAEAANRAKSEFLANMSHEIRTPLNGIIGMIEMTLITKINEEQKENLDVAKNCADTLLALINDVLDLSKVESNKVILEDKQFDIRQLVQRVTDTQTAKVLEKELEIKIEIEEKIPPFLYGDPLRLQQVLTNLLANAVKFTEQGSVLIEVKQLCHSSDSSTIVFSVEDTGIGIGQNELNRLFKPFSQVDGSISRKYGGTGLGLAISQSLINLMGGEIKVKSQKGKGSVFYFTIQMKVSDEEEKEEIEGIFTSDIQKENNILVVEDDRANQLVIRQMLNKMGYTKIDTARTGFEAIKLFEQKQYQVILMDIQLPELDGIGTTHIIREKEKKTNKHIPIIALTAHALKGDKEKFLQKGMDAYIAKPVNPKLLKDTLDGILQEKVSKKREEDLKEAYASWQYNDKKEKITQKEIAASDKRTLQTLINEIKTMSAGNKTADTYIQIEKKAHEIKVRAERKEYDAIKTPAFRLELASRKKDYAAMEKIIKSLHQILNEKTR